MPKRVVDKALTYTLTFVLCTTLVSLSTPIPAARADESLDELQTRINQTASSYNDAVARQKQLAQEIAQTDSRISELEKILPEQKAKGDESYRTLYKYSADTSSMVMLLLGANNLSDALAMFDSFNWVISYNIAEIQKTVSMTQELEQSRSSLQSDKAAADEATATAKSSLEDAKKAREEAQAKAEAAQKAEEAATSQTAADKKASTASSASKVNWSSDKTTFVAKWAPRINSYLSGSPMAGCGEAYAQAAWDNGVDPRWAPAISYAESSLGAVCFRSHNAWGFGSSGYASWTEGINAVVSTLGRSPYGGYLTRSAAAVYCPSNPSGWYGTVSSQMSRI